MLHGSSCSLTSFGPTLAKASGQSQQKDGRPSRDMVAVRSSLAGRRALEPSLGCGIQRRALLGICPVLSIKPGWFVRSLVVPSQLKERKMRRLVIEGLVRTQGWESPLPDYQPCPHPQDSQAIHHTDTLSLILPTVPIGPSPTPQSSKMPWASLLCPPWPSPRPSPPPAFCPGLSLCQEPLTCSSCFFPQGSCSPGGLTPPRVRV